MAAKNLVIVESPGKIQAISKYLGADYTVMASMGHVRDLPKTKMGIDTEHNFEPSYIIPAEKKKVISGLKSKLAKDTTVYIATDEDREGEAIGWHLVEALGLSKHSHLKRIVFHEITKPAILEAMEHPRQIDKHLVDAQQTRRVLDRLVGYELSPLLWKKIKYGLSAGRVQSVAVRLIVEREREIQAFKPQEYWTLLAELVASLGANFRAKVVARDGVSFEPHSEAEIQKALQELQGKNAEVTDIESKEVNRYPAPPFTTSTLQQEAARKLGFSVKKTMTLAQHLYEGVELATGHEGLITYMRTDSVNLSPIALKQAKEVVTHLYGAASALSEPRYYKGKKGAQEAHEAIRPTDLSRTPDQVASYLSKDELRLYELIWKRTLACQMAHAIFDQVGVDLKAGIYDLRATGQTLKFPGFMHVYMEGRDDEDLSQDDAQEGRLPELKIGEKPALKEWLPEQHFTKAPPRYTEASLVKKLEAEGIGRPSTYAPTISTILARDYIRSEKKQLIPTEMGFIVSDFLVEHFPKILDIHFTVKMEDMLDAIAEGDESWQEELRDFYKPFHALVDEKMKTLTKDDVLSEKTEEICEQCGSPMAIRFGRFGKFLSCTNFPTCKNARPLKEDGTPVSVEEVEEERAAKEKELSDLESQLGAKKCSTCGKAMHVKTGRFGPYWACEDYPKCKTSEAITKGIGVKCPVCNEAELTERHTRRGGKPFYGCPRFPKCRFAIWEKPSDEEHARRIHEAEQAKQAAKSGEDSSSSTAKASSKSTRSRTAARSSKSVAKKKKS